MMLLQKRVRPARKTPFSFTAQVKWRLFKKVQVGFHKSQKKYEKKGKKGNRETENIRLRLQEEVLHVNPYIVQL